MRENRAVVRRAALLCLAALLLAGCPARPTYTGPRADAATVAAESERQHELYRLQFIDQYRRVAQVAWPILVGSAELCAERSAARPRLPFSLGYTAWVTREQKKVAPDFVIGDEPMVVVAFEPGYAGGVRDGDVILAVNGRPAPRGAALVSETETMAVAASGPALAPVTMRVRRGAETVDATVQLRRACTYAVDIEEQQKLNAFADGKQVMIWTGLMRYLPSNTDLAFIVGHEIAHNLRGHIEAKKRNQALGRLMDAQSPVTQITRRNEKYWATAYSQDFEREADYVGLYLAARGGYDITDAPNLDRKIALAQPTMIDGSKAASHPSFAQRAVLLEQTVQEIRRKQAAGVPLLPERH
jgi:hypothetical protein